jgi:hypothetical protein
MTSVETARIWTEAELLALVSSGERESLTLDFKACDALSQADSKKNELSKDVAAFANSAGGTIVYGIREVDHVATEIDIGFDPAVVTKEWLEQVINSRIQRRIDGIRITQVSLAATRPGKVAYVVDVPQSARAPHQSWDKRFYRRFNFESVPMEEYEIRDVANRSVSPDLRVEFALIRDTEGTIDQEGAAPEKWKRIDLSPAVANDSVTPCEYASIHVYVDERLEFPEGHGELARAAPVTLQRGDELRPCTHLHVNWGVPGRIPIFEGLVLALTNQKKLVVTAPAAGDYLLGWQVHAPKMQPKTKCYVLSVTPQYCALRP